ncbi:phosphodiesterase [Alsobacter metallidurans]|uniref:Phosphodiesterase n=1 Tax=Alsobacter metallidurans TaxID=340221 RepID=A0A917I5S5_9HYPH|nr:DUF177 domain-containing protein [Alsobacter metallidurans]GGH17513.1 phosphodiesterase [Alsobacter metallidurans]
MRQPHTASLPPGPPPLLSRPFDVNTIKAGGSDVVVVATEAERAALAQEYKLVGVDRLEGRFKVSGRGRTVSMKGLVTGDIRQTCVVTLEEFPSAVSEEVDLKYSEDVPEPRAQEGDEERSSEMIDAPDPIINGKIDLGALTAEFLALGLDPYPRKPGVETFAHEEDVGPAASPFAALAAAKRDDPT